MRPRSSSGPSPPIRSRRCSRRGRRIRRSTSCRRARTCAARPSPVRAGGRTWQPYRGRWPSARSIAAHSSVGPGSSCAPFRISWRVHHPCAECAAARRPCRLSRTKDGPHRREDGGARACSTRRRACRRVLPPDARDSANTRRYSPRPSSHGSRKAPHLYRTNTGRGRMPGPWYGLLLQRKRGRPRRVSSLGRYRQSIRRNRRIWDDLAESRRFFLSRRPRSPPPSWCAECWARPPFAGSAWCDARWYVGRALTGSCIDLARTPGSGSRHSRMRHPHLPICPGSECVPLDFPGSVVHRSASDRRRSRGCWVFPPWRLLWRQVFSTQ